jgi:alginate O-acetyltransferase complex protein AlgI
MAFSSLLFIFGFLPLFLAAYYATPRRLKNLVALLASCLFYSWGAADILGLLLIGLVIDYVLGNAIARTEPTTDQATRLRKALLTTSIVINIGALGYYKYSNFFVTQLNAGLQAGGFTAVGWKEVVLPIGISFFTFHKISYVVDIYRKVSPRADSFVNFALYVLCFPQLVAGPIIRYHDVAEQLVSRRHPASSLAYGAFRFCIGLAKKVLIANQLAVTADHVFGLDPGIMSTRHVWLGIVSYTFQIYFDFSGYSDMALGLGHLLGITFRENFDCPYRSLSITEFWRRWHISLSTWMKEYLYVPLGGNRVGNARTYVNLWIVFLVSGLWHGANWTFIVWGIYHGTFLVIDRLFALRVFERWPRPIRVAMTFVVVAVGWVFFRAPDLGYALKFLGRLSGLTRFAHTAQTPLTVEIFTNRALVALVAAAFISFLPVSKLGEMLAKRFESAPSSRWASGVIYLAATVCLLLSCASLANSGYNPFIYFRF